MRSNMKKKVLAALILGMLFCTGCGKEAETEEVAEEISATMEGTIEVVEDLPERDIEIPEYMKSEEDLSREEEEEDAADHLEEEEKTTAHLSGEEQTEAARQIAGQIEDSINQVLADKDYYPNITGISVNAECTEFNVTLSSKEISLYENVLPMSLCIVGNKFQLYQGKQEDELMTVVNYIDADSGEIFSTINSGEIE